MIEARIISDLEKCFPDGAVGGFETLEKISVLRNERFSFQLIARPPQEENFMRRRFAEIKLSGKLSKYASVRTVECIPSLYPCYPDSYDDNYLSSKQGLYPDLLLPPGNNGRVPLVGGELRAYWITVDLKKAAPGDSVLGVKLVSDGETLFDGGLTVHVADAFLPDQVLINTQWLHGDCLSSFYNIKVFSPKWWKTVDNFVGTAVRNGQNMLLTPIFTPPLDTAVGGERPTVQLVKVRKKDDGYAFSYENLDRWIDMCDKRGIKYLEISHLFTQWGAAHAPKIIAETDDGEKRIFGWETDAAGEEYSAFLQAFIPDFLAHMKKRGDDKRCYFHISDEPNRENLQQYIKSKNTVKELLKGYPVMDALSNPEFYRLGVVTTPIVATNHIKPFIEDKAENLWAYYCCGQNVGVSNRFFAMPSYRTRCIGYQLFKYDIAGFLQWGYNFYYSQQSLSFVNPYLDSSGNYFAPSGDCYSVYPAPDGTAYESLRLVVFHEALQDLRACSLLASLTGKKAALELLEKINGEIDFSVCPHSAAPLLESHDAVITAIEKALEKGVNNHE